MVIKSYSNINLFLKVNRKSKNYLHEIQSLFCFINLFYLIKIKKNKKKDKVSFKGNFSNFIKKKNNSIFKLLYHLRKLNLISDYYSIETTKIFLFSVGLEEEQ